MQERVQHWIGPREGIDFITKQSDKGSKKGAPKPD